MAWMTKNSQIFSSNFNKPGNCGRFLAFMQLCDATSFDFLVESLKYAADTKIYLYR